VSLGLVVKNGHERTINIASAIRAGRDHHEVEFPHSALVNLYWIVFHDDELLCSIAEDCTALGLRF
jgi:hypothetical protein